VQYKKNKKNIVNKPKKKTINRKSSQVRRIIIHSFHTLKKKIELEIEEKSLYLRGKKERFKKLNKRKK